MSHHYVQFRNVRYVYPNGFEALRGVSFRISHGEKVALLGNNGSGKSTLLLHTNGLLMATSGEVNIGDIPVTKATLPEIRRSVGLVFQNADDQLFMPTVEEDIAFGPINMQLPPQEIERRVAMALELVGASTLRKQSCYQLSGGQKRSVAIATVLSMEPSVLVMDEPTSNLDTRARRQVLNLIKSFFHTCLIATHDLSLVRELCPRTILLQDGQIIADGSTDEIMANKNEL